MAILPRRRDNGLGLLMLVAWLAAAIYMTVLAFNDEDDGSQNLHVLLAIVAYGMTAFHIWLEVRRWRRQKRIQEQIAQKKSRNTPSR